MLQHSRQFFEPCLPSSAKTPPTGPDWLHEIKHDGFRVLARRDKTGVRLFTRNGNDFGDRFPLVVAAVAALPHDPTCSTAKSSSATMPGSQCSTCCGPGGHDHAAVLCAFDLIKLDGKDLRQAPLEERKRTLAKLVRDPHPGIALNEHYVGDGDTPGHWRTSCHCSSMRVKH